MNVHDAKTNFSKILARVEAGEEVVITKAGREVAKVVPLVKPKRKRILGTERGKVRVSDDFDAPLPNGLLSLFEG